MAENNKEENQGLLDGLINRIVGTEGEGNEEPGIAQQELENNNQELSPEAEFSDDEEERELNIVEE
ncbi:hypothetical protein [Sporohalobacter salinus]|uniref:hypothetical protein n=1 Tax=Sporohalobacter salinus TaxID=1494606 RepID=UPI0019615FB6|nr:hypothetical protein [Sporohalobacter salinus]MBM7623346.1 hypothetical protein [Sporohalobacter salinus]